MGAEPGVAVDRGARGGQDRDVALLAALAADAQRLGEGQQARVERQRLGYPQAAAVEQRDDREIAGGDPVARVLFGNARSMSRAPVLGQRARQTALVAGRARQTGRGGVEAVALGPPAVEGFDRRKRAGQRPGGHLAPAFGGHPRADVGAESVAERRGAGRAAQMRAPGRRGNPVTSRR
jgi:hypothetical protein